MCRVFGSALPAVFSCSVRVKVSAGPPVGRILMRRNSSIQSGMFSGDGYEGSYLSQLGAFSRVIWSVHKYFGACQS
ncbi:hypothetical protein GOODEAATRI_024956, partial [Goodea atripinnis]